MAPVATKPFLKSAAPQTAGNKPHSLRYMYAVEKVDCASVRQLFTTLLLRVVCVLHYVPTQDKMII
jgi:hypothetical protein